jgi:hypothetical protein
MKYRSVHGRFRLVDLKCFIRWLTGQQYTFKAAAEAVAVCEKSLYDWHKKFAPPPVPCGDDATVSELQAEVKQLRRKLKHEWLSAFSHSRA